MSPAVLIHIARSPDILCILTCH